MNIIKTLSGSVYAISRRTVEDSWGHAHTMNYRVVRIVSLDSTGLEIDEDWTVDDWFIDEHDCIVLVNDHKGIWRSTPIADPVAALMQT